MELEEMKTLWEEMTVEIEKQKKLTASIINKMTQTSYRNKINRILVPETIGSLFCLAEVLYILINIHKLNAWYLLGCGIVSVLILCLMPILSVRATYSIWSLNILENDYKKSLMAYSKAKIQFMFVQKLNFYFGALLIIVLLPVMGKLVGGKDFFSDTRLSFLYAIMFPFFYPMARWVFKKYTKSGNDAENILQELKD